VNRYTYLSRTADDSRTTSCLDRLVDDVDIDRLLDDFVFEPNCWDLASAIGIGVDPKRDPQALDELADAMRVWCEGPELERLTDEAVERVWDDELAGMVREGIVRLGTKEGWEAGAADALAEFDRDPPGSEVAREVVRHLAMQFGSADQPFFFCLDCLEYAISHTPPQERRALALRAAILGARNAAVPDDELRAALADVLAEAPAARLATVTRREAIRSRLGRIGRLGERSMPLLAAELRTIAAEPLPECAEDDDVWQAACAHILEKEARPAMN